MRCLQLMSHALVGLLVSMRIAVAADPVDFERDIRPILSEHCYHCHGPDDQKREGKLRLDTRDTALVGGESGVAGIVPGQPGKSELLRRVMSTDPNEMMPPKSAKKRLTKAEVDVLSRWIEADAPYSIHWAFRRPHSPAGINDERAIDTIVGAKLAREKISPAPPATAEQLCRRLYLDIVGLPPTPAEVQQFVARASSDPSQAIAATVDTLLGNPRYGEKWARHWLDVARYSDSNGFEKDLAREQWAWRDWVIRSINQDLPYDQFVIEQIAGDLIAAREAATADSPLRPAAPRLAWNQRQQDLIVATGFLRNGMVNEEGAIVAEQFRIEGIFDRMDCIGKGLIGLTLQCAQCHSHKFDPVTQKEYYGMFAFLDDTYEAQSAVYTPSQLAQIQQLEAQRSQVYDQIRAKIPDWKERLAEWVRRERQSPTQWQVIDSYEQEWIGGLNHPEEIADHSILVLGHPSVTGTMYVDAHAPGDVALRPLTGVMLEALTYGDLPFGGPGRSLTGTFALTELKVEFQTPENKTWTKIALGVPTADFEEPDHLLEPYYANPNVDKDKTRRVGPAKFATDGSNSTAWRCDRGPVRRNAPSVLVVPFAEPKPLPEGTKLRITIDMNHGGEGNKRDHLMLGRMRFRWTQSPAPVAPRYHHLARLVLDEWPADLSESAAAIDRLSQNSLMALLDACRSEVPELAAENQQLENLWKQVPEASTSVLHMASRTPQDSRRTRLLDRGVWDRPRDVVPAALPASFHSPREAKQPDRYEFARWLVDDQSPLAARVQVNRVWQAVFGAGLVETPEDFGTRAPNPPQQDLLDWLANDFMKNGWSQKKLLRRILLSKTYQQSSIAPAALMERDPQNRWLARGPRFRVDAELVRDIALSVSGLLNDKLGGPSVYPPVPQSVIDFNFFKPKWEVASGPDRYRRSLYVFRKRSMPDPALMAFDAPNADLACPRRVRSNTPLAALVSLNEPVFVEAAQALALRILREGGANDSQRAGFAYRLCLAREPLREEQQAVLALLAEQRKRLAEGWLNPREIATGNPGKLPELPEHTTPQDAAAWTIVSRVLLNLDETLTKQ